MKYRYEQCGVRILEIQEIERKRIAMELHDSTIQSLTHLIHKAELCELLIDRDVERAKYELSSMRSQIHEAVDGMRRILYNLQPMELSDIGLSAAITNLASYLSEECNVHVTCHLADDSNYKLCDIKKLTMYRIAQEACNNAVKHGNASKICIEIEHDDRYLTLRVDDNGLGFDVGSVSDVPASSGKQYGLFIMKERVYLLGGTINIQSRLNKGTKVTVCIEIDDEEGATEL